MSNLHITNVNQFLKTVLETVTHDPDTVGPSLSTETGLINFISSLKDRQTYCRDVGLLLRELSDSYPNLYSDHDYSFKDILGSFPADDPARAGWWLVSMGASFQYIIASVANETEQLHEFEERCDGHLDEEDIYKLIELYVISSKMLSLPNDEQIYELYNRIKAYDGSQKTVEEILGNDIPYLDFREYSVIQPVHYQPCVTVYSISPQYNNTTDFANIAIAVRMSFNEQNIIFTFVDGVLEQYPKPTLSDELHDMIVNN